MSAGNVKVGMRTRNGAKKAALVCTKLTAKEKSPEVRMSREVTLRKILQSDAGYCAN